MQPVLKCPANTLTCPAKNPIITRLLLLARNLGTFVKIRPWGFLCDTSKREAGVMNLSPCVNSIRKGYLPTYIDRHVIKQPLPDMVF